MVSMMKKSKSRRKDGRPKQEKVGSRSDGGSHQANSLPIELQQVLLNVFKDSLTTDESLEQIRETIQEVKHHLYNRDFPKAFGKEEYLRAYAFRWSPGRSLAYLHIFHEVFGLQSGAKMALPLALPLQGHRRWLCQRVNDPGNVIEPPSTLVTVPDSYHPVRIVCIGGGGGAEIVGIAGLARVASDHVSADSPKAPDSDNQASEIRMLAVDMADWMTVVTELEGAINRPPPLSKYASEAARAANRSLLPSGMLNVRFERQDMLATSEEEMVQTFQGANLVTIMFTLNELFSTSIAKTTRLLLQITDLLVSGALLLVVDSPGSYSTVRLGANSGDGEGKKYPMKWLLDHTLLELAIDREDGDHKREAKWEKVISEDSRWFRLNESLKYPVDLEDMRYQMHLFRKR